MYIFLPIWNINYRKKGVTPLVKSVKNSCTSNKLSQRIWLNYFNDKLLEQGLITDSEYRCIREKILEECSDNRENSNSFCQ